MNKKNTLMAIIIFICLCIGTYNIFHKKYDYIDMNNNKGFAEKCYANDKGLFCTIGNKIIEVKQFGKR